MLSIVVGEINPDLLNVKETETGEKSKIILKTLQEWPEELKLG